MAKAGAKATTAPPSSGNVRLRWVIRPGREAQTLKNPFAPIIPDDVPPPKPHPPLPAITAKEAARLESPQWLVHAVVRFPERKNESRAKYFERLAGKMRGELGDRAWGAVHLGRQIYELGLLPRRQLRAKKLAQNSH
jgi:hypothetical protein